MTIRKATRKMFKRYLRMTSETYYEHKGTALFKPYELTHKRCQTALDHSKTWPIDKLSRWLGFIQLQSSKENA